MNQRGIALITSLFFVLIIAMIVRGIIALDPGALSQRTLDDLFTRRAAEAGAGYARTRLNEDTGWRGQGNGVIVNTPEMQVVEDNGNVFGLLHDSQGKASQFRIRFNYQDGGGGADGLPDPSGSHKIDHIYCSVNNLLGKTAMPVPQADRSTYAVTNANSTVTTPAASVCVQVEGRVGPAVQALQKADDPLPNGKYSSHYIRIGMIRGQPIPLADAPVMAGGGIDAASAGGVNVSVSGAPILPKLRSKKGIKVWDGGNKPLDCPGVLGRDPASGVTAAVVGSPKLVDEKVGDNKDFLHLTWASMPAITDPKAVQLKAGTYVLWPDGSCHYYDKDYASYKSSCTNDIVTNTTNTTISTPDPIYLYDSVTNTVTNTVYDPVTNTVFNPVTNTTAANVVWDPVLNTVFDPATNTTTSTTANTTTNTTTTNTTTGPMKYPVGNTTSTFIAPIDPGLKLSPDFKEVRTDSNAGGILLTSPVVTNVTGAGTYFSSSNLHVTNITITEDVQVVNSTSGVDGICFTDLGGCPLYPSDTRYALPTSNPNQNIMTAANTIESENFSGMSLTGTRLACEGDFEVLINMDAQDSTIMSNKNIVVSSPSVSVLKNAITTTINKNRKLSMFAGQNLMFSTFQRLKTGGSFFNDMNLEGLIYAYGNVTCYQDDPFASVVKVGKLTLRGAIISYGADPSLGKPGTAGNGVVQLFTNFADLILDVKKLGGSDLFDSDSLQATLVRHFYADINE